MERSSAAFEVAIWPAIKDYMGGGELIPVESVTNNTMTKDLDQIAGIDAWHILRITSEMRGIACRVQWISSNSQPWYTFTIRLQRTSGTRTEWHKRFQAIKRMNEGWLFPAITVQGYLARDTDELLTVGCVETDKLIKYIVNGEKGTDYLVRENSVDGNKFIAVHWDKLRECGVKVYEAGPYRMTKQAA